MAVNVPSGMALRGSLRSPDIFTPAIIPVTAGKNIANTIKGLKSPVQAGCRFICRVSGLAFCRAPMTNEITDIIKIARIPNCILMVQPAPTKTIMKTITLVMSATAWNDNVILGNAEKMASVKPTTYKLTAIACAT